MKISNFLNKIIANKSRPNYHWGGLNANEQCHECKGRIKLMPCGVCMNLFCLGCYESRWAFGHVVKICKKCMPEFSFKTGKGLPIKGESVAWFRGKDFF